MMSSSRVLCDADPASLTIEQAQQRIRNGLSRIRQTETIECSLALGRVISQDIASPISVPSFRSSAMDGYAVRVTDCGRPLKLIGQSMAGHPGDNHLDAFSCQRITTGARVPDDADAVVQQENVDRKDDIVSVRVQPQTGLNIRLPGSDNPAGALLIGRDSRLGAAELALLAAHGITRLPVYRRLTIALFSTGDELRHPGASLEPGQIYDSNRPLLHAMLADPSVCLVDLGICSDSTEAIEEKMAAAHQADMVISSGGVSVGDADHVRMVLERSGQIDLWKIAMKPGRPLTFGFSQPGQAFFGLPGNPVSMAITTLLFVRPAIRIMLGADTPLAPPLQLPVEADLKKNPGRVEYQRAVMRQGHDGKWTVGTTGLQDSHVLSSLHKANCLVELGIDSAGAKCGEPVQVYPFTHFAEPIL